MRHTLLASALLALLVLPLAAFASQPAIDATTSTRQPRITTGVLDAAVLQHPKRIHVPLDALDPAYPSLAQVDLKLDLNKKGRAQDVRVVSSDDPFLNASVVAAVHRFHWRPARLDHRAIPTTVDLRVLVRD